MDAILGTLVYKCLNRCMCVTKAVGTTTAATVLAVPLFMKPFAKCMAVHTSCIISKLFISFLYKLSLLNG